jgi:hypothetical protein
VSWRRAKSLVVGYGPMALVYDITESPIKEILVDMVSSVGAHYLICGAGQEVQEEAFTTAPITIKWHKLQAYPPEMKTTAERAYQAIEPEIDGGKRAKKRVHQQLQEWCEQTSASDRANMVDLARQARLAWRADDYESATQKLNLIHRFLENKQQTRVGKWGRNVRATVDHLCGWCAGSHQKFWPEATEREFSRLEWQIVAEPTTQDSAPQEED